MRPHDSILGLILLFAAGVTSGSFTFPMKFTRRWAWENIWFAWTIFALLLLPLGVTLTTLPQLREIYAAAGPEPILILAAFGVGWGVAQVFFGLAVDAIGIALAFSIVPGMSAALGSLIPLIRLHPKEIFRAGGVGTMVGVALTVAGICVCARAGARREAVRFTPESAGKRSYSRGLILAICSGFGSAMANLALAFGEPLIDTTTKAGANPVWAPNAVWLPLMLGGALPNALYCLYLLNINKTGARFIEKKVWSHWLYAFVMAAFWFGSMSLYGMASARLGSWGTILGWPLFMSLIVITASVLGMISGEWKGAGNSALRMQISGVGLLILAVFALSAASQSL
jgi:L-rhamnose-H+ transport protein